MPILQYDSRDAVLGGLRRDYNLADYPAQENDLPVKLTVQPVVEIKDLVKKHLYFGSGLTIVSTGGGAFAVYLKLLDPIGLKDFKNWLIVIKNGAIIPASDTQILSFGIVFGRTSINDVIYAVPPFAPELGKIFYFNNNYPLIYDTVNYTQSSAKQDRINFILRGTSTSTSPSFTMNLDLEMYQTKPESPPRMQ